MLERSVAVYCSSMGNREYWTIGVASLGAIAASQGQVTTLPDIVLGAVLSGGITFGIASTVMKKQMKSETKSILALNKNNRTDYRNSRKESLEIPKEMPDTINGWYPDPSKLHVFRYLHNENWTDYVSDSSANVGIDKKGDLETTGRYQPQIKANTIPSSEPTFLASSKFGPTTNTESSNTINDVSDLIVHLERLSNLLNEKVITEEEFESLKKTLLA